MHVCKLSLRYLSRRIILDSYDSLIWEKKVLIPYYELNLRSPVPKHNDQFRWVFWSLRLKNIPISASEQKKKRQNSADLTVNCTLCYVCAQQLTLCRDSRYVALSITSGKILEFKEFIIGQASLYSWAWSIPTCSEGRYRYAPSLIISFLL